MEAFAPLKVHREKLGKTLETEKGPWMGEYGHKVQMYQLPPTETISLLDFQELAIKRLKVLKIVEEMQLKHQKGSMDYFKALKTALEAEDLFEPDNAANRKAKEQEGRRRDHISHFILRLAFCRSSEGRQWFLSQETELFRHRLTGLTAKGMEEFLAFHKMDYKLHEKTGEIGEAVFDAAGGFLSTGSGDDSHYIKVPFLEALDLVRQRKCFLKDGFAHVLRSQITPIIAARFRAELSRAMARATKYFGQLGEDERLGPFLKKINAHTHIGNDFQAASGDGISLKDLNGIAAESFPPCMAALYREVKAKHHLKHGGRQQLGLFLKGIGLTLDQALAFWRMEFTRAMDVDAFNKNYAYNIRHNYGREGRRKNYSPYSCSKIICSNPPGPGDSHGCPFKHNDSASLRQTLLPFKLKPEEMSRIVALKESGHYDQACSRLFEFSHGLKEGGIPQLVSHPNGYFQLSREYRTGVKSSQTIGEKMAASQSLSI